MEDPFPSSSTTSSFLDHHSTMSNFAEMLNDCSDYEKSSSLGFMELLNMQDFGPASVFDVLQTSVVPSVKAEEPLIQENSKVQIQESSEVLNAPTTPNSSSISSESTDGQKEKEMEEEEEDDDDNNDNENQKTKKQLKAKKTSQKRQREPRFAFMTKSEVDHLEDGYRWRKYGQKAVKNSPFPRSYYRCTNASCNVKKRVERSYTDRTIVVTTYEGQHTHPSPQTPRPTVAALPPPYNSGFSANITAAPPPQMVLSHHNQQRLINYSAFLNSYNGGAQQLSFCSQTPNSLLADNGLLQDIVPWSAVKNEE